MSHNPTRASQERIYRELFEQHKGTPMAVSSESEAHKRLRFSRIAEIFSEEETIDVHDVGMGVGAFRSFLQREFPDRVIHYSGSEILPEYVAEASALHPDCQFYCRDIAEAPAEEKYDYLILSGVFHQRRDTPIGQWEKFSQEILRNAFGMCRKGIAFNFVSPFVDFYQTQVYYCNLPKLLNFINDDLSRFFTIQHNYALFELTVHVFREDYIHSRHPEPEFSKYFHS